MPFTSDRIRAGAMRHRVQFVKPSVTPDSTGGIALANSTPVLTCAAEISALTGKEVLAAMQFSDNVTHFIKVRYDARIKDNMQIQFQGPGKTVRTFQIEAVMNPTERNKLLVCLVQEISDSAGQSATNAPAGLR